MHDLFNGFKLVFVLSFKKCLNGLQITGSSRVIINDHFDITPLLILLPDNTTHLRPTISVLWCMYYGIIVQGYTYSSGISIHTYWIMMYNQIFLTNCWMKLNGIK